MAILQHWSLFSFWQIKQEEVAKFHEVGRCLFAPQVFPYPSPLSLYPPLTGIQRVAARQYDGLEEEAQETARLGQTRGGWRCCARQRRRRLCLGSRREIWPSACQEQKG